MRPLVIELFCGRFGWSKGFVAEGYRSIGFDIVHEDYHGAVPDHCELVLQDVLTLHGSQFRDAAAIVASPPCQAYSWMAMPWKLGKAKAAAIRADASGALMADLTALFDACFRIQGEASAAAGHHIPIVVENVKGAQPWVGRAAWNYGSFYLWGDVPALMPFTVHRKVPGMNFHEYEKTGKPGRSFQSAAVDSVKVASDKGCRTDVGNGVRFTSRDCGIEGMKNGGDWFGSGPNCSLQRKSASGSNGRKEASAAIAEIPFELALHIARCFNPSDLRNHSERPSHCAVP